MNVKLIEPGEAFVTRKISASVARIAAGLLEYIELGYMDAVRDWSHAKDIVEGCWLMCQADKAGQLECYCNQH